VIVSDIPGISEILENYHNGILVPPKDSKTLAAAILELINNPLLRIKLSVNARSYILKKHSWGKILERVSYVYNYIL